MKKFLAIVVLNLVFLGSAFAAGTGAYVCKGRYGGFLLNLSSPSYSLQGNIAPWGENPTYVKETCYGKYVSSARGFSYYSINKECSADYLRVNNDFNAQKGGIVSLANRSGGDDHDYSGYVYRVFQCTLRR